MKLLFVGPLWGGSTALQRMKAFEAVEGFTVFHMDSMERAGKASMCDRIRERLRWPADHHRLNELFLSAVDRVHHHVVFIDSSRVVTESTLKQIKAACKARVAFFSPDDITAPHNSSRQLEACDGQWD